MTRHFPLGRGARTTKLVVVVAMLSLGSGLLSPALADREDDLRDREDQLSDEVEAAERHLDDSSRMLARADAALQAAQVQLSEARGVLADVLGQLDAARALDEQMRSRLDAAEQRLAAAEADLAQAQQTVRAQQDRIERFAVRNYLNSDPGLVSMNLVLSGQSPSELTSSISAAESVVDSQTASLDRLDASRILQSLRQERVEELRDQVAVERAAAADNLERKRELTQQARAQTQLVRTLVGDRRSARQRAQQAKAHDLRLLAHMRQEREQVEDQLAALAARQAERRTTPSTTTTSGDSGGFLGYPLDGGYVTSSYGMRMHPILNVWKLHDGTDFGAPCGTPVYASAAGTIVSAYYDAGYGNRLIMNHGIVDGVSLSTSYNHLTSTVAGVGEYVQRGQLVAYSGTTGYSTGCHLHFMVYVNGATTDPMGWL